MTSKGMHTNTATAFAPPLAPPAAARKHAAQPMFLPVYPKGYSAKKINLFNAISSYAAYLDAVMDDASMDGVAKKMELERAKEILLGDFSAPLDLAPTQLLHASAGQKLPPRHALHLLQAATQGIYKKRVVSWSELLALLQFSAAPIGRMVLEVHGEAQYAWKFSDPLCMAYAVLRIVGNARQDFLERQRVYLPDIWLRNAGAATVMLAASKTSPELRVVFDQMLDGAAKMLLQAGGLVDAVNTPEGKLYASRALAYGGAMLHRLRSEDPLQVEFALPWYLRQGAEIKARWQLMQQ